ncbi:MAG: hypothetical protein JWN48_2623 [Myxococcaceae bacterium]|nr:hypothetical protein [Myxococcaceae bacterium]
MQSYPACPRCYSEEEVVRPWPGFRVVRRVWIGGVACVVTLSPILFSDIVVMIPLTMAFLFAGGPVLHYAKETPTCRSCGLSRPHPGWHETPCRPVRAVHEAGCLGVAVAEPLPPLPQPSAGIQPDEQPDEQSGVRRLPDERDRSG